MKQFPMALILASILSVGAAAQPSIQPPQMGFAGNADGSLRPVYGVAGNFILGSPLAGKVVSYAFSGSLGLLKTDATLVAFDQLGHFLGTTDAATGPALFAFSPDGAAALAYIASSNTLVEWNTGKFATIPYRTEPDLVVAISMQNAFEPSLIIDRNGDLWEVQLPFNRAREFSQKALVGVTAPLLALASGGLVYSDAKGIVLRNPDGSEVRIGAKLPAKFSLQQMDSGWVQLNDLQSARRFAIRMTRGHEGFYQLPEVGR
jgi:hypothetical protein